MYNLYQQTADHHGLGPEFCIHDISLSSDLHNTQAFFFLQGRAKHFGNKNKTLIILAEEKFKETHDM